LIREKGKATAKVLQLSPEASGSLLRWRLGFHGHFNSGLVGVFSLAMDSRDFSGELVWFAPLLEGKQSWEHFAHQPCGRSISLLWMQECRPPSPQDAGMILPSMGDGILTHLP
jgi:hypothetical protein